MLLHSHAHRVLKLIPRYGLGNRLLALASAIRLVNLGWYNEIRLCWYPSYDLGCKANDILEGPFVVEESKETEGVFFNYLGLPRDSKIPVLSQITVEAFDVFTCEGDNTPPLRVNDQLCDAMALLRFHDRFHLDLDVKGRIGLHCRRSDYPHTKPLLPMPDLMKYHRRLDKLFADVIASSYPTEPLFLATDSAETDAYFKERFGTRLLTVPKKHYPNWSSRPPWTVDEGVVDMLMLSRCQKIVADSFSTFSTAAGWLGRVEKLVWPRPRTALCSTSSTPETPTAEPSTPR